MLRVTCVPIANRHGIPVKLIAVIANRPSRAAANPLLGTSNLLRGGRLLEDVGDARPVIASDVIGRALAAEIAVRAMSGDIILTRDV